MMPSTKPKSVVSNSDPILMGHRRPDAKPPPVDCICRTRTSWCLTSLQSPPYLASLAHSTFRREKHLQSSQRNWNWSTHVKLSNQNTIRTISVTTICKLSLEAQPTSKMRFPSLCVWQHLWVVLKADKWNINFYTFRFRRLRKQITKTCTSETLSNGIYDFIFTYIWSTFIVNVRKSTIHGSYWHLFAFESLSPLLKHYK